MQFCISEYSVQLVSINVYIFMYNLGWDSSKRGGHREARERRTESLGARKYVPTDP